MESLNKNSLTAPVTDISGVGKVRAAALAKLGIERVSDLLLHYPRAYEHRGDVKTLEDCISGEKQATLLTVGTEPRIARIKRGMNLLKFRAYDESGVAEITFFNQDYLKSFFELGSTYRFFGKVEKKGKKFDAALKLEDGRANFVFEDKPRPTYTAATEAPPPPPIPDEPPPGY